MAGSRGLWISGQYSLSISELFPLRWLRPQAENRLATSRSIDPANPTKNKCLFPRSCCKLSKGESLWRHWGEATSRRRRGIISRKGRGRWVGKAGRRPPHFSTCPRGGVTPHSYPRTPWQWSDTGPNLIQGSSVLLFDVTGLPAS